MYLNLARLLCSLKTGFILYRPTTFIKYYSIISLRVLSLVYRLGYISGFSLVKNFHSVKIYFKYINNKSILRNIYLVSKSSRRLYLGCRSLKGSLINNFVNVNGFLILSTSKGIRVDVECVLLGSGGVPLVFVS